MSIRAIPRTWTEFRTAPGWCRFWWGVRPRALERARERRVEADVEAAIRNLSQLRAIVGLATIFTSTLTIVNQHVLLRSFDLQSTWSAFALAMAQVGAYYALRRSNETRAYLGEARLLLHELAARSVLAGERLSPGELAACTSTAQLRSQATRLLNALMESRLFPDGVDAFSLWARDDRKRVWRIVAAIGASDATVVRFEQTVIDRETMGAGVVANLAVAEAGTSYYQASAREAPRPWFKSDASRTSPTESLAVFLLPNDGSEAIGAFAITSPRKNVLGVGRSGIVEHRKLIIDQCSLTLVAVARRANELWSAGL